MPMPALRAQVLDKARPLGFWTCWSLTVGIMIGSGIFLLPSVLAPYGLIGFSGWVVTAAGSICLALIIARLASRTTRSGGVYAYAHDAFGSLTGFLVAWGYWAAYWIAMPAMAIAFVGYLGVFIPALETRPMAQAGVALALIWAITLINMKGLREASLVQVAMTILKLIPLLVITLLAGVAGTPQNLPEANPSDGAFLPIVAATALLTMWAFSGLEAGTISAGNVKNPERTVPRAILIGTITVALIYIASTIAVMLLVPAETLVTSTKPFADAASHLGSWGPALIAIGAMISTAGALNGTVYVAGQLPIAVALDGLAPRRLSETGEKKTSGLALILAASLASILLLFNYTRGLVGLFTFLIMMSTLAILVPLFVSALAELRHSWKSQKAWALIGILGLVYSAFTMLGSGLAVLAWGLLLFAAGLPVYLLGRQRSPHEDTTGQAES